MGIRCATSLVVSLSFVVGVLAGTPPAGAQETVNYRPPVDAPVVDPFRAPRSRFGPGNRGLTYDLAPGTTVRAAADGEVVFAGSVAGSLHVTVLHADGLRTSYSFLESVRVIRGRRVSVGDVVGTAGGGFHFGVRDGAAYLDPASLFGGVEIRVRLVPHEEPLPPTDAGLLRERLALQDVVDERNAVQRFLAGVAEVASRGVDVVRAGHHVYDQIDPLGVAIDAVGSFTDSVRRECSGSASVRGDEATGRIALLVAGYGSDSRRAGIDGLHTDDLGYGSRDVLRYSYAGGRVPDPRGQLHPDLVGIPARPYGPTATFEDLEAEGVALADLVEDVVEARPGVPVDLYAHSQGGIVARLALLELADRPGGLDALGVVVTIGTPHDGADIATVAVLLDDRDLAGVDLVADLAGLEIDAGAVSVRQLAETSDVIRRLQREGVPDGVSFRTIGARGDPVVTGDKTKVDGHPAAMLDLFGPAAHNDLPASAGTTTEVALALQGRPPSCRGVFDHVLDAVVPELVSSGENIIGAGYFAS